MDITSKTTRGGTLATIGFGFSLASVAMFGIGLTGENGPLQMALALCGFIGAALGIAALRRGTPRRGLALAAVAIGGLLFLLVATFVVLYFTGVISE